MERIERIRDYLIEQELDAILVSSYENRRYLSGFTGSSGYLLISRELNLLITDLRYVEQAGYESPGYEIVTHAKDPFATIGEIMRKQNLKRVAFESMHLTYDQFQQLSKHSDSTKWVPLKGDFLEFRAIKDEEEIKYITKAIDIAERSLADLCKLIKPGMSELEIAIELEYRMKRYGSEGPSFPTIVASGQRSSLPHAKPTSQKIAVNDMITIDFGAIWNGYMCDITRTVLVGEPEWRMQEILNLVLSALEAALSGVKPGVTCAELDRLARDIFVDAGLEEYTLKGLGHGVGLQIHEYPRVVINQETVLEEGMIFTVEPGVYIPHYGGVRIEDMVCVTESGCQLLTKIPRVIRI